MKYRVTAFGDGPVILNQTIVTNIQNGLEATVESSQFALRDLTPAFNFFNVSQIDDERLLLEIECDFVLQNVTYPGGGVTVRFDTVDSSGLTVYKNFQYTTINKYQAGKGYVINPNNRTSLKTLLPSANMYVLSYSTTTPNFVFCTSRALFYAIQDTILINVLTVDILQFDYDWTVQAQKSQQEATKINQKVAEIGSLALNQAK